MKPDALTAAGAVGSELPENAEIGRRLFISVNTVERHLWWQVG